MKCVTSTSKYMRIHRLYDFK